MRRKFHLLLAGLIGINAMAFAGGPIRSIIIDPAHGGADFGVDAGISKEKNITLAIAQKIQDLANAGPIQVELLRTDDQQLDLDERVSKINDSRADIVISIHLNSSDNVSDTGIVVYYNEQNKFKDLSIENAHKMGKALQAKLIENKNMKVSREAGKPVVVVELGYMSNPEELVYLSSEEGQTELAQKILESLQ